MGGELNNRNTLFVRYIGQCRSNLKALEIENNIPGKTKLLRRDKR